jgi:hypothetical protein
MPYSIAGIYGMRTLSILWLPEAVGVSWETSGTDQTAKCSKSPSITI